MKYLNEPQKWRCTFIPYLVVSLGESCQIIYIAEQLFIQILSNFFFFLTCYAAQIRYVSSFCFSSSIKPFLCRFSFLLVTKFSICWQPELDIKRLLFATPEEESSRSFIPTFTYTSLLGSSEYTDIPDFLYVARFGNYEYYRLLECDAA
jgi:hypothetical protein